MVGPPVRFVNAVVEVQSMCVAELGSRTVGIVEGGSVGQLGSRRGVSWTDGIAGGVGRLVR